MAQEELKNTNTFLKNRILFQNHYLLFSNIFRFIFRYISNYLFYIFEVIKKCKVITYILEKQIKFGKHKMYCSKKRLLFINSR